MGGASSLRDTRQNPTKEIHWGTCNKETIACDGKMMCKRLQSFWYIRGCRHAVGRGKCKQTDGEIG